MLLIFDLDGTLIDSSKDLALSINAMLAHLERPPLDEATIHSYVGNGAPVLVRRSLGPDAQEREADEGLEFFLRFYRLHALEHTRLYPQMRESIETLSQDGHSMAILTNKPVRISIDIVKALGLGDSFFRIYGGDSFSAKKPDPTGIDALRAEAVKDASDTLMVGDSGVDIQTAKNAGVRSCGVLWGFQPEAFQANPPDFMVSRAAELVTLCRQLTR